YCLTLAIATVAVLAGPARWRFRSLVVLGALVATTFLFRQLTGAFLAMGVVGYLLLEGPADRRGAERGGAAASRALLMLMAGVLLAYSVRVANGSGFLLLGLWPVSLLLWGAVRCRVANRELLGLLAGLGCGALGAAIPTLGYHVLHGSLAEWFRDCVLSAWRVESLPYVKAHSYFGIMTAAVSELRGGGALDGIVNNLYWMLLPLMGVVNGVSLLVYLARSPEDRRPAAALPYIAAFYGMVSLFNQIPMYLYYALGLLVPGVLWTRTAGAPRRGSVWEPIIVAVGIVALYFHAAQPATRTLAEVVDGVRIPLVQNTRIPRTSLWLEPRVVDAYGDLVDIIQRETQPDGTIFVLPNHPEVYFFAQRTNPFWFPNTSLAVQDPNALDRVLRELAARPPALVIYAPLDRHRTAMSDEIIAFVERRYERIATIGEFVVYRRPPPASDRAASP
ncbi:MAG: hypothetical protein ACRERC_24960, partial [Candidatus Binatia bacterium]